MNIPPADEAKRQGEWMSEKVAKTMVRDVSSRQREQQPETREANCGGSVQGARPCTVEGLVRASNV